MDSIEAGEECFSSTDGQGKDGEGNNSRRGLAGSVRVVWHVGKYWTATRAKEIRRKTCTEKTRLNKRLVRGSLGIEGEMTSKPAVSTTISEVQTTNEEQL